MAPERPDIGSNQEETAVASRTSRIFAALGLSMALSLSLAAEADAARRGGGFGSRGARTYQAPPPTKTAPGQVQPIQRSMTSPQAAPAAANRPMAGAPAAAAARRPGFFGNPLVRGLMLGGLIGLLLGHGLGGAAGMLGMFLQIALVAVAAMLLFKLFARRRGAAPAAAHGAQGSFRSPFDVQQPASGPYAPPYEPRAVDTGVDFAVVPSDREDFERLLREIQEAYGREDYGAIRERTTPEIMGYLAEELGQNASQGLKNEVTNVKMLEGDVAEAWREGDTDYATAALRYSANDVMRARDTGAIVEGDPDERVETTELWTFTRRAGEPWKLSAIQQSH
jgi:predicted lipid-binding transport protein (Tim44 family)